MSVLHDTNREHRRTSLFVLASMSAPGLSASIKIRNLSPSGALIEGRVMPALGQPVTLWRGKLSVSGQVVWCYGKKAGVRFDEQVTITDWLPAAVADPQQAEVSPEPGARLSPENLEALDTADALDSLAFDLRDGATPGKSLAAKLQALETASRLLRSFAAGGRIVPTKAASR